MHTPNACELPGTALTSPSDTVAQQSALQRLAHLRHGRNHEWPCSPLEVPHRDENNALLSKQGFCVWMGRLHGGLVRAARLTSKVSGSHRVQTETCQSLSPVHMRRMASGTVPSRKSLDLLATVADVVPAQWSVRQACLAQQRLLPSIQAKLEQCTHPTWQSPSFQEVGKNGVPVDDKTGAAAAEQGFQVHQCE